jgi:hypothetical protein
VKQVWVWLTVLVMTAGSGLLVWSSAGAVADPEHLAGVIVVDRPSPAAHDVPGPGDIRSQVAVPEPAGIEAAPPSAEPAAPSGPETVVPEPLSPPAAPAVPAPAPPVVPVPVVPVVPVRPAVPAPVAPVVPVVPVRPVVPAQPAVPFDDKGGLRNSGVSDDSGFDDKGIDND